MSTAVIPAPGDPGFDTAPLEAALRRELPHAGGGALRLERIGGGQSNPTFFLGFGERLDYVLRKPPAASGLAPGAHAVDREVRVLCALAGSAVPVPTVAYFHADPGLIGTPFYVMERLRGRILPWLVSSGPSAAERREMVLGIADTLGALHSVDWRAAGLEDFGRPAGFFARQLDRLGRQWRGLPRSADPDMARLASWLGANIPADDRTVLVHGDFRIGNLVFDPQQPRLMGVLDWELSTLGHPMADLAYGLMAWHLEVGQFDGVRGADADALGIPTESEYRARYYDAAPAMPPIEPFHLAFMLYRGAVLAEGIVARAAHGMAPAQDAQSFDRWVPLFMRRALQISGA